MKKTLLLLLLSLCGLNLHAADKTDKKTPAKPAPAKKEKISDEIDIKAKKLTYERQRFRAIFEKDVIAISRDTTITCERMTCLLNKDNEIQTVICEKNVVIVNGKTRATSQKAIYDVANGKIMLLRKPVIVQNGNTTAARRITLYLHPEPKDPKTATLEEKALAGKLKRVHFDEPEGSVITPPKAKQVDKDAAKAKDKNKPAPK